MSKITRAKFLGLSAVLAGGPVGFGRSLEIEAQATSSQSPTEPDLVVVNARVYTIDERTPELKRSRLKTASSLR